MCIQAKVDSFEQYLDPELCSQNDIESQNRGVPTRTPSPKPGPSIPPAHRSVEPTIPPGNIAARPPRMRPINTRNTSPDAETPDFETSPNRRKRNHHTAFSASTDRSSSVTTTDSNPKTKVENREELWKKIMTDMLALAKIYLDFARTSINNVVPSEIGLETLDMAALEKPTSFPGCVQQLMTVFTAEALDKCFEDAFEALDYDIADKISMASRALGAHVHNAHHACDDSASPNEAQKRAGNVFLKEAARNLSMLEQMTKGDAIAEEIKAQWSSDTEDRLVQLMQLVIANEGRSLVDVAMQYMQAAQVIRAEQKLEDFLEKVKRMTRELVSDFNDLKDLQK